MKKFFLKKIILLFFIIISGLFLLGHFKTAKAESEVRLYFFRTATCPHCKEEAKFLDKIEVQYPFLKIIPIFVDKEENQELFKEVIKRFDLSGGVPTTIIGDEVIVGYDNEMGTGRKIKQIIEECSRKFCGSFLDEKFGFESFENSEERIFEKQESDHQDHKTVQLFGKDVCLEEGNSLCFLGAILGLVDGINPCMFSVLAFLLVYLMGIGSSKKALKAGLAFIITTFLFYLFFMVGLVKIITVLKIANEVRVTISVLALITGLIMVKDFFFYGKWISLKIPEKTKPILESLTRKGTVLSAIALALLASIVELPCTSGIPLAYVSILSAKEVASFWYLVLYNFFFILPLVVIVFGTVFVWKRIEKFEKWRQKSKKYMRLVTGILLFFLGLAIWNGWL